MSDILKQANLVNRVNFDPTNAAHLESFKTFLRTGTWGELQFYPEIPYIEVPMTVMMKFALHTLDVKIETAAEKAERLSQNPRLVVGSTPEPTREERIAKANELMGTLLGEHGFHMAKITMPANPPAQVQKIAA